jgi:hypothetical protein
LQIDLHVVPALSLSRLAVPFMLFATVSQLGCSIGGSVPRCWWSRVYAEFTGRDALSNSFCSGLFCSQAFLKGDEQPRQPRRRSKVPVYGGEKSHSTALVYDPPAETLAAKPCLIDHIWVTVLAKSSGGSTTPESQEQIRASDKSPSCVPLLYW